MPQFELQYKSVLEGTGEEALVTTLSGTGKYRQGVCWNIIILTFQSISAWRTTWYIDDIDRLGTSHSHPLSWTALTTSVYRLWAQTCILTGRNFSRSRRKWHRTEYSSTNAHPIYMKLHRILPLCISHRIQFFSTKSAIYSWRYSSLSVTISDHHGQFFRWLAKIQNLPCKSARLACKI